MTNDLFIFAVSLFMVIRGATMATKYAAHMAEGFRLSKYVVGFIIVAVISILPETFISIDAAIKGMPSFGLGVLFGSNIADLTLIFSIIILLSGRGLRIESKILKNRVAYPLILFLPLILGWNGFFSRAEGVALILAGGLFYYFAFKDGIDEAMPLNGVSKDGIKNSLMLVVSMSVLLLGSHFTVTSASSIADRVGINPVLIGMLIVGLGTTMPELFFSLKSAKREDDSLAVGDILGTVLADATVVVGIVAVISPFYFPQRIIYVTGLFMVAASLVLFKFMRSGRTISKREALSLFFFWVIFVLTELVVNS